MHRTLPYAFRSALLACSLIALAACTTAAYRPGITSFVASSEVAAPLVAQELASMRRSYRESLINRGRRAPQATTRDAIKEHNATFADHSICIPAAASATTSLSGTELTKFGEAATNVATVPEPTFWTGVAGLFQDYKIPSPRPLKDFEFAAKTVRDKCTADFNETRESIDKRVYDYVTQTAGATEGVVAGFAAFQELIALIEPVATQALATIDEQRRAAALRDFFSDKKNVGKLKHNIELLVQLSTVMDTNRRLRAMLTARATIEGLPLTWKAYQLKPDSPKAAALMTAADAYDAALTAEISPAFAQMSKTLDKLEKVASGEDTLALLQSASESAMSLAKAVVAVEKLTTDPESKKQLRAIWRRLLGKKPEKEEEKEG
jgi:hypothetical protein